jgi:hypothetical protein
MTEHTESRDSRDSLDVISNAIIKETFLGLPGNENSMSINERPNERPNEIKETKEDEDVDCCSDSCFKWWFFHSSFQIPSKTDDIKRDLLHQRKQFYCCDVCSECLEVKLLNYCASSECTKQHCSDCFYNGCQLSCCCFTFILSSK